jgi:hypothetical protein
MSREGFGFSPNLPPLLMGSLEGLDQRKKLGMAIQSSGPQQKYWARLHPRTGAISSLGEGRLQEKLI